MPYTLDRTADSHARQVHTAVHDAARSRNPRTLIHADFSGSHVCVNNMGTCPQASDSIMSRQKGSEPWGEVKDAP